MVGLVQTRLRLALISEGRLPPSPLKGELGVVTLALIEIVPVQTAINTLSSPFRGLGGNHVRLCSSPKIKGFLYLTAGEIEETNTQAFIAWCKQSA